MAKAIRDESILTCVNTCTLPYSKTRCIISQAPEHIRLQGFLPLIPATKIVLTLFLVVLLYRYAKLTF